MLKETAAVTGGVVLFSPIGMPFLLHGIAGAIVGAPVLIAADSVLKNVVQSMDRKEADERAASAAPSGQEPASPA